MECIESKQQNPPAGSEQQLPTILIVDFCDAGRPQGSVHPVVEAIFEGEAPENILQNDPANSVYKWRLKSKYFEADLQFCVASVSHEFLEKADGSGDLEKYIDDNILAKWEKIEAIAYYMKDCKRTLKCAQTGSFVESLQSVTNPEMAALFYDGPAVSFDKQTDKKIEEITSQHFIEYITQDLSDQSKKGQGWSKNGQGLLDQDNEKHGVARLHEALQCCMWSNMTKVNVPQIAPLPKGLLEGYQPPSLPMLTSGSTTGQKDADMTSSQAQKPNYQHSQLPNSVKVLLEDEETPAMVDDLMRGPPEDAIEQEEAEAESMLKLMEEIQNVRETNKHLNDEERRQNAEKIMMKLAAMMQLGGESDGEDDYGDQEGFEDIK